jgi:tetratricopeptide (TPR) repeat protein
MNTECVELLPADTVISEQIHTAPPVHILIPDAIKNLQKGDIETALFTFEYVLHHQPDNITALAWCGTAYYMRQDYISAIDFLEKARALSPHDSQILSNLGQSYMNAGLPECAKSVFENAFMLNNHDAEACYYLAFFAAQDNDFGTAELFYKRTLTYNPLIKNAYAEYANILHLQNKNAEAFDILKNGIEKFPDDSDMRYIMGRFSAKMIPSWHLPMLSDAKRNDAYYTAIKKTVTPNDIVLDIGTGSGLLAMMAARSGAKHVYACESNPILAKLAVEIIEKNGLSDKITIIPKHSSDIIIGQDMPSRADILITEIFDRAIIGEDALATFHHAQKHLLKNNAVSIPHSAQLYGTLTSCPHLQDFHHVGDVHGFDLRPMNDTAHLFHYFDAQIDFETSKNCDIISEDFLIYDFDFTKNTPLNFASHSTVKIKNTGRADCVTMYFDLILCDDVVFSTKNTQPHHHWQKASQILLNPVLCKKDTVINFETRFSQYFHFMPL